MARIKRAGINFLNFFKAEEILPAEFKGNHELENFDKIQNTEFYINF
jgi:hypothetical protein